MITVTDAAVQQLHSLLESRPDARSAGLRIYVETGGCSGMQYGMSVDESKEGDHVIEREGVRILVDAYSHGFLDGSTIDFEDGLSGSGFRVQNPNANRTCGCGSSFEPRKE